MPTTARRNKIKSFFKKMIISDALYNIVKWK
jgi:hypothetical protein